MDFDKLDGLVSAIESESKTPSPSHQNLARLVALFYREFIEELKKVTA